MLGTPGMKPDESTICGVGGGGAYNNSLALASTSLSDAPETSGLERSVGPVTRAITNQPEKPRQYLSPPSLRGGSIVAGAQAPSSLGPTNWVTMWATQAIDLGAR